MAPGRTRPPFHAVLLAGGGGTRFWPLSRARRPKQLLALASREPLLVETWRRARVLASTDRIWVVAPAALAPVVRRVLPDLRRSNLVVEPSPRDTAPAIALACATLARRDPAAVAGILPTDHVIRDVPAFARAVRVAASAAEGGSLVCLGIRPDRPATGYGYLRCAGRPSGGRALAVERFVEKPDGARARRFVRSGRYLWNGGMFVWSVRKFLDELGRVAPRTLAAVEATAAGRKDAWTRAERLSVDYAVMEKARGVKVVPLDAGWDDVGSWGAVARLREAAGIGDERSVLVESPGSLVVGGERLVAVVGVPGVVVVDTPDALLVVARDRSERVREVVRAIRDLGRKDLL